MSLDELRLLRNTSIRDGNIFLYGADFNVGKKSSPDGVTLPKNIDRISDEVPDINYLTTNGGSAVILAHYGRFSDGSAEPLDFVADTLSGMLETKVEYFPENNTQAAIEFVRALKHGSVAIMGNARVHEGEEKNDAILAQQFAQLALANGCSDAVIGGWGKYHRKNASNFGVLEHVKGYVPQSVANEIEQLAYWAGSNDEVFSVGIPGGLKGEKITDGLAGFVRTYDMIFPGGIVLNTILLVQGKIIGESVISDEGKTYEKVVSEILANPEYAVKIVVPDQVIVAKKGGKTFVDSRTVSVDDGVPEGYMIVDSVVPQYAHLILDQELRSRQGRFVFAGTPGIYTAGFREATDTLLGYANSHLKRTMVLGGDTAAELREGGYNGEYSTGGGSSLHLITNGTTPVLDKLRENTLRFR